MKTKTTFLIIFCSLFFLGKSNAQTISVFSKEDKQPLPAANLIIQTIGQENKQGIAADNNGVATISSIQFPALLTISYIGYETIIDTLYSAENKKYFLRSLSNELKEVVVTAQYEAGSPEKSVHKVRIIDSKQIEQRGATNMKDLLQQEMNIRLSQDNILGTSMTMGGVSGENVKILIDGVAIIGRQGGNLDLSQINLSNVERIEIVEGPLSVNYGTNALGGVINIITKKTQYERIEAGLNTYYETSGQHNADAKVGYKFGTNLISLTGQRNFFDGWSQTDPILSFPKEQPADSTRFREWKPKEQYMGGAHYHKNLKTLQLHLVSNYFQEKITNRGMPREPYYENAFDDYYRTYRWDNTANIYGTVGTGKNISILAAYNDYKRIKNTYYKDLTTLDEALTTNPSDQDTTKFILYSSRGTFSTSNDSAKINYEIGYDVNIDNGYGIRIIDKQQQIGDYAIFASAQYTPLRKISDGQFQLLTIRPGLRYAYNTAYKAPLVPSINILYKPKDRISIRASYAKGFRAPSLKELYFEFVDVNHSIFGNPDLKAETSDNYQFSLSYSGSAGRRFWRIEPSFYYNNISNLITLAYIAPPNLNSYINVGKYITKGSSLNTSFGEQELMFSLGGNIYWLHSETESDMGTTIDHGYTPEGTASVKYQIIKTRTQLALFYKYTGAFLMYHFDEDGDVELNWMDNYHTLDFTINQPLFKKRAVLAIGGKNLLNVRNIGIKGNAHTSHTGGHNSAHAISMPVNWGRTFFVNLKINISQRIK